MPAPKVKDLFTGNAGFCWNVVCCPIVAPLALIFKSFQVYCGPCVRVLLQRIAVGCVWRYLFPCCFVYEDKAFAGPKALGDHSKGGSGDGGETAKQMEKGTDWVRAHELVSFEGKRPQLFEGEIEPSDLCQGAVGDCWLVAAMACASEFPHMIRQMFITKEYNPRGKYQVRIFDPIKKRFVVVTVDDYIPCHKGTKKPRFMSPNGNELWAIILEKAYAKFCGSYADLAGGFVLWGWLSMTGDHVFQMTKNDGSPTTTGSSSTSKKKKKSSNGKVGDWYREDMKALQEKGNKRACGFARTKETYTTENIWTLLKRYDQQRALMSASISKSADAKRDGPAGEEMLDKEGLVAGHAYSVIQAREVKGGFRLLQLRNPWGSFEWKGAWSDKSKLWKDHPAVAKQLKFVDADDGAFWMTFEDFIKVYTRINICDRTTARDWSLDVNEDMGSCGIFKGFCFGCTEFWCCCRGFHNLYFAHHTTDETLDAKEKMCWIC